MLVQLDAVLLGTVMNWGLALFLFGAAMTIFQSQVLARWMGWLAVSSAASTTVSRAPVGLLGLTLRRLGLPKLVGGPWWLRNRM